MLGLKYEFLLFYTGVSDADFIVFVVIIVMQLVAVSPRVGQVSTDCAGLATVGLKPDAEMSKKLRAEVEQLEADLKPYDPREKIQNWNDPQFTYFADIAIFPKAVRWALDYNEFYKPADFTTAEKQLKLGRERLEELKSGVKQPSWTTQRGLTVRGYISPIDNSVQPYGVHVPENVDLSQKLPLYIWLHGRGEKVTDLHFIQERLNSKGKFAADDGITVHPFGRYCNAFKFLGERDVLDVMQQAEVRYQTDPGKRILIGFSMGGAGVWHIGSRYPHLFCAIARGRVFRSLASSWELPTTNCPRGTSKNSGNGTTRRRMSKTYSRCRSLRTAVKRTSKNKPRM